MRRICNLGAAVIDALATSSLISFALLEKKGASPKPNTLSPILTTHGSVGTQGGGLTVPGIAGQGSGGNVAPLGGENLMVSNDWESEYGITDTPLILRG